MKLAYTFDDHHCAGHLLEKQDLKDWLTDIFEGPSIAIEPRCTHAIRSHVERELMSEGWAHETKVHQNYGLTVMAEKHDVAFQLQTGNVSRAFYDLLKMQYLYECRRIEVGVLAVPTQSAAKLIGSNLAYAERVIDELGLFNRIITLPVFVIAFE